jgi:glutathione S-transferase
VLFYLFLVDEIIIPLYYEPRIIESRDITPIRHHLDTLEKHLAKRSYYDDDFGLVDILLVYPLALAAQIGVLQGYRSLNQYVERNASRKAFSKAYSPEETPNGGSDDESSSPKSEMTPPITEEMSMTEFLNTPPVVSPRNHRSVFEKPESFSEKKTSSSPITRNSSTESSSPNISTLAMNTTLATKYETIPTLFHVPGHRSTQIIWLLGELEMRRDVDYKLISLGRDYKSVLKSFNYLRMNPNGKVPILTIGKTLFETIWEPGAIIQWLVHKKPSWLIPDTWKDENYRKNALFEYWCLITFEEEVSKYHRTYTGRPLEKWWLGRAQHYVKAQIEGKYVQGDRFTITDIFLGYGLRQLKGCGVLDRSDKKIIQYYETIQNRRAFKDAIKMDDKE